jgi:hypothetical protein
MVAMFVDGSGQNEQSVERTFHRCFLPTWNDVFDEVTDPEEVDLKKTDQILVTVSDICCNF